MGLEYEIKVSQPKRLIIKWKGELWREVDKALFINDLRDFPSCSTTEEFIAAFEKMEAKLAKLLCYRILSQRSLLSSELEKKVKERGISAHVAKTAVEECSSKGFLNDREHLKRLVAREQKKGLGKHIIAGKLRFSKGVDPELLSEMLEDLEPEEIVLKQLVKKYSRNANSSDPKAKQKLIAKLMRRGFSYPAIASELRCSDDEMTHLI